jgi:hypothetical protein
MIVNSEATSQLTKPMHFPPRHKARRLFYELKRAMSMDAN